MGDARRAKIEERNQPISDRIEEAVAAADPKVAIVNGAVDMVKPEVINLAMQRVKDMDTRIQDGR